MSSEYDGTEDARNAAQLRPRKRPTFYRVRFDGDGDRARFLGFGPTGPTTRGYPSLVRVHECEAWGFDSPRVAAETALQAGCIPFTVEVMP